MRIFRDAVCKQHEYQNIKYGAQKDRCFHFTKTKIIGLFMFHVRDAEFGDFATNTGE